MDATKKAATIGALLSGLLCLLAVAARNASRGGINGPAKKERDGKAGSHEEAPGRRALRLGREKLFGKGSRQIKIKFAGGAGEIVGELPDDRGRLDLSTLTLNDLKVESFTTRGATIDSVPATLYPFVVALRDNHGARVGVLEFELERPEGPNLEGPNLEGSLPQSLLENLALEGFHPEGPLPPHQSILEAIYKPKDNLIVGTIPQDSAALQELDTLVLAFNQLSGEIPGHFFRYPDMTYWDVGFRRFEGTIPQDIPEQMPDLQVLFGENNQFSGTLPENLGTLDLKNIHLDDNNFAGTIPSTFGDPPNLVSLMLHGNQFTGTIPENLATPEKMVDAKFHYNSLEGEVSNSICENMYQGTLKVFSVDCETVSCECCICGEPGV